MVRHPEPLGLGPDRRDVVLGPGVPDQEEAGVGVECPVVVGEGGDQIVLALVADDPADVEPVVGPTVGATRLFGELAEVDPDREYLHPVEADGKHLPAVEIGVRDPEQGAAGQGHQLFASESNVTADRFALEVLFRGDVVVHGHDVVGQGDDVVEGLVPHRMMEQEEIGFRTSVAVDRVDAIVKARGDVLGEDLGLVSEFAQEPRRWSI